MDALSKQLNKFFNHTQVERQRQERNETARYRRRAKKLAEQMGVHLDVEIRHYGFGDSEWTCYVCDPRLEGDQFCTSWSEVVEKLESLEQAA